MVCKFLSGVILRMTTKLLDGVRSRTKMAIDTIIAPATKVSGTPVNQEQYEPFVGVWVGRGDYDAYDRVRRITTHSLKELNACLRDLKALILKLFLNRDLTGILDVSVMVYTRTGVSISQRQNNNQNN